MTNNEILQADLLDILFENRNKAYGAYALRKNYNHRLQWALGISLGLSSFLVIVNFGNRNFGNGMDPNKGDVTLRVVDLPKDKPKTVEPPQAKKTPIAQIRSTQIKIVPNDQVKKPEVPTLSDLQTALTSTVNRIGISPDSSKENFNAVKENGNNNDKKNYVESETHLSYSDAMFPGGREAFAEFLRKYLVTPDELEVGEKKAVLVRFMVDVDGTISKVEIVQTGGDKYDREVIRVLHKMPKWLPATQNGIKVATWFTQPVTFIGVE
jgi:periplasmic protein TonB